MGTKRKLQKHSEAAGQARKHIGNKVKTSFYIEPMGRQLSPTVEET